MNPVPADLKHFKGTRKIYRLVLTDQLFENNGILQRASLSTETTAETENYLGIKGHKQMLYLVKFTDTFKKANNAYIFYSLKFDVTGTCIGYKPIKAGSSRREKKDNAGKDSVDVISLMYEIEVEPNDKTIRKQNFTHEEKKKLFYKPSRYAYEMKIMDIILSKSPVLFILNPNTTDFIEVEKIMVQYPNKIGGKDFLLYNLVEVMPDNQTLKFNILK